MEKIIYVSLAFNVIFLMGILVYFYKKVLNKASDKKLATANVETGQSQSTASTVATLQPAEKKIMNLSLHTLAEKCEERLSSEFKGKVKILVEKEKPALPAILQIGELNISLKRKEKNQSMFSVVKAFDALQLARDGYNGTGRYIPVPKELERIIEHRDIINVYLEALNLEPISEKNKYWVVDTETGWNTGWKRFEWSVDKAYSRLYTKFKVWQQNEYTTTPISENTKLILLLKGWEHLFVEA